METVNIHEAKTNLSRLIERVRQGDEFIIAKSGTPVARLVGLAETGAARRGGHWRGLVHVRDDFDEPLPPEVEEGFRGEGP